MPFMPVKLLKSKGSMRASSTEPADVGQAGASPPVERMPALRQTIWQRLSRHLIRSRREDSPKAYASLIPLGEDQQLVLPAPFQIVADQIAIGCDPNQTALTLDEPALEPVHTRLVREGEKLRVLDGNTTAGTWVNYERIPPQGVLLEHGDLLHIGRVGFRFALREPGHQPKPVVILWTLPMITPDPCASQSLTLQRAPESTLLVSLAEKRIEACQMNAQTNDRRLRVFSGIQPSGHLHIGNYLGAIRQWVAEQHEKVNFFCIVDMHAITLPIEPAVLQQRTRQVAALYLACGLDPQVSTIFVQSHVPAHAECCWILNCVTPLGWLERMTQFKTKSSQQESVSTGLLDYPVLQAADILLYDSHQVPVGDDQKQHVELARDIAQRFNYLYGETFIIPEVVIPATGARIRALNEPTRKMSKSEAEVRGHAIRLIDPPDEIRYVIQRAVTDSGRDIRFSEHPEKAG
jgi:tryptophanyl-tRNA synthetase